jgi:Tfp pilus assembly ATPase PilU
MAAIDITPILKLMLEQVASDLFFSCGSPIFQARGRDLADQYRHHAAGHD